MPRGSKPGERRGGRKPGVPNKRTAEREAAMKQAAEQVAVALGEAAFEGDAHAFLMTVYKNPAHDIAMRIDAAKAAAPYEKPRLSQVDARVQTSPLASMSPDELRALDAALAADESGDESGDQAASVH